MKRESIFSSPARFAALAIVFFAGSAQASAQETAPPRPEAQIQEVASRILQEFCSPATYNLPSPLLGGFDSQLLGFAPRDEEEPFLARLPEQSQRKIRLQVRQSERAN